MDLGSSGTVRISNGTLNFSLGRRISSPLLPSLMHLVPSSLSPAVRSSMRPLSTIWCSPTLAKEFHQHGLGNLGKLLIKGTVVNRPSNCRLHVGNGMVALATVHQVCLVDLLDTKDVRKWTHAVRVIGLGFVHLPPGQLPVGKGGGSAKTIEHVNMEAETVIQIVGDMPQFAHGTQHILHHYTIIVNRPRNQFIRSHQSQQHSKRRKVL
mmetsp:Transcript_13596/g.20056  ORF Transcript_13596/g.20056 Transcript_13596/m.20056 type:complete len:209 (-) Transcript_13596:216-842(-)